MPKPRTKWIRDNGTILVESTDLLVDELSDLFIDEDGENLLDSVSSDGLQPKTEWVEEYA